MYICVCRVAYTRAASLGRAAGGAEAVWAAAALEALSTISLLELDLEVDLDVDLTKRSREAGAPRSANFNLLKA